MVRALQWVFSVGSQDRFVPTILSALLLTIFVSAPKSNAQTFACIEQDPLSQNIDYEARIKADPNDYLAVLLRGWALFKQSKADAALAEISHALELKPDDSVALEARSRVYFSMARYPEAINDLTNALLADPHNVYALFHRAEIYRFQQNYGIALDDLTRAVEVRPDFIEAYENIGHISRVVGDEKSWLVITGKSLDYLDKKLNDPKLEKCKFDFIYARAVLYLHSGQVQKSVDDFSAALRLKPYYHGYYLRGIAYFGLSSYDLARADLSKAIELQPLWADSFRVRAIIYRKLDLVDLAVKDEQRYQELSSAKIEP